MSRNLRSATCDLRLIAGRRLFFVLLSRNMRPAIGRKSQIAENFDRATGRKSQVARHINERNLSRSSQVAGRR
ncbi:hypothetical protein YC2023_036710 [Brassica napus]